METGSQLWGGGGSHSRSNSNIQPPWECDLSAATVSTTSTAGGNHHPLDASSPSQHHRSTSNGGGAGYGGGGGSYLDSSSLPPSPLETLYRRTASFSNSRSLSTSPAKQEDPSVSSIAHRHHHHHGRSFSISGIPGSEGGRRQSLSGPLPSPENHPSMALYRRPSLSGPLPLSSSQHYPYNISSPTFGNEIIPPLNTPSPWSEYHMNNSNGAAPANGGSLSNPYLNPFSPNGSMSVSSNSLSPTSLPRPPSHQYSNGNDSSPSIASPNSVGNRYPKNSHNVDISPRGPPVRQLYGYSNGSSDPFATLVASSSPLATTGEQWATFPANNSQKSLNGKPLASGLSQRTHGPASLSAAGRSPRDSMNGGSENGVSPSLTRSKSVHNRAFQGSNGTGGVLPFNTRGTLNRSASYSGAEALVRKYSKGRGGLGEGVLETLVAQLVFAKEKPSMLADMIFCPSKLSSNMVRNSKGPFAYARNLVERILLAQVHALTPSFKDMAQSKSGEFEDATWALSMFKNGKVQERFPNEGYRLLRLQTQFVEAGLETFDMLCRIRKQFPSLMMLADDQRGDGANNVGLLRIACFGGGPGCEALAIRLFFMRLLPTQLQMQVDVFDRRERWKEIVDNISLQGVGLMTVDLFDVIFHPTWLRSYRLLVFIDSLGRGVMNGNNNNAWRTHNWAEFWRNLFGNTSPGVVVIIQEKNYPWEEMRPKKGSNWWCSALAEQELVHVARKII